MANAFALANILSFNSKLNAFRENQQYCDVCIEVDGRSFKCHRVALAAASDYFDAMFGGNFRESKTDQNIILKDIDADAFEEILRFIYTGDVIVTRDNVFSLILASEFLKLVSIEDICVQFIRDNLPLPEMFEMLTFASQMRKNKLIEAISQYIMQHIDKHCTDPQFLELSFDDLNALLSQHWYLSPQNEDKFLGVVTRWLSLRDIKEGYFEKLNEKIDFHVPIQSFSANYLKLLLRRFTLKTCEDNRYCPPIEPSSPKLLRRPILGLHVYTEGFDGITRISSSCKNVPIWNMSCYTEYKYDHIRSIGLGNFLYCLDYIDSVPTFRTCSSIDVSSMKKQLKTPPAILMEFDMCNVRNTIYVNSSFEPTRSTRYRSNYRYAFNDEEINQGIYGYNVEIDEWFPLPICKEFPNSSAITASKTVLYLLEGLTDSSSSTSRISIQALDSRTSKWQDLTKSAHHHRAPLTLTCCAHEGKIYTCSGDKISDIEVGMFDLKAGKWQKVKSLNQNRRTFRLLSYENLLWAFGRSDNYFINIETYNSFTQEWNPSPILGMIGEKYSAFMDVVIFKSTYQPILLA